MLPPCSRFVAVTSPRQYGFAEEAHAAGVADACLFGLKGHALSSLGRHAEAAEAYAEALKLGPDDPYVRHLVAASGSSARSTNAHRSSISARYSMAMQIASICISCRLAIGFRA